MKTMDDRAMAQRHAHGVPADAEIIKESLLEEQQAPDHRRGAPLQANSQDAPILPMKMVGAAFAEDDGIDDNDSTPACAPTRPVAKHECCACADEFTFEAVARVPCGHHYCRNCLKHLFTLSLTQEILFPPRCCRRAMDAKHYPLLLPLRLLRDFQTRMVELTTDDRTYCHVPGCGKFILPQNIRQQVGRCVACNGRTCSVCKNTAHVGDCPEDLAVKALESLAAQNGWRRCNDCRRIVELSHTV
ncbi:hypothetical protein KVR01_011764 [Diaporthe batatas]|uniref:uncharacterized protein n=1 Tax=Diaporthe batatas TaxID=748121 RepID=UPI001D036179|nr:uncharacterized protein KVR01_011764 [Diaporthe batatas]KAG8158642.1 hypothetical protein KVR01_011764 [Diaporthe batatas]